MHPDRPSFQRRSPKQARARATVDAIVEAAAQVLERRGADGFNTAAVAERAGVSIGTLYQYFPDKQAILAAAAKRALAEGSAAPAARRRALIEALIAMVEGFGRLGAVASPPRTHVITRRMRRGSGWERRCAEAFEQLVVLLIGPQPAVRPIPIERDQRPAR